MSGRLDPIDVSLVTAVAADGVRLYGALAGTPAGGGILGVHGAWGNFYATPIIEFLRHAPAHGVLALSLNGRGHDLGGMDDGARSIGIMRECLEAAPLDMEAARGVLAGAGADRYVVVAHSFGGARATYWLASCAPPGCAGVVLLAPPPTLAATAAFFVDGAFDDHIAAAQEAVAAGEPERLVIMRPGGRIPMMAEAATVLSIWAPESPRCNTHAPDIPLPFLVVVGDREPPVYREEAERTADAAEDATLVVVPDEDHYFTRDRERMASIVFDWVASRELLEPSPSGR